jgi:CubicO group peptidase (beta-lactamase class C family)
MRFFSKGIVSLYLVISIVHISCDKGKKTITFEREERQQLDSFLLDIPNALPIPGLAIAIIKDNKVFYKVVGKTQVTNGLYLTDNTLFFTGNLSEPMVATAIMKLVEDGKIKLEDPVFKHLRHFELGDSSFKKITIKHLLTHTSGVPHHPAMWDMPNYKFDALTITTRSIHLQQPVFIPAGSQVKRTPYNYDILADLIEKVTTSTFEEHIKENVFNNLTMSTSTYSNAIITMAKHAEPHKISDWLTYAMKKEERYPYNREHLGSIGLHATMKDLSQWMYMLLNNGKTEKNKFLENQTLKELLAPQFKTSGNSYIGLGWEIKNMGEDQVFSKNHQLGGFALIFSSYQGKIEGSW